MRDFLEQADAARRTANEIRRHIHDHEAYDRVIAAKHSERLDARAAELEYRWLTLPPPPTGWLKASRLKARLWTG